jgi:hypothetical protein
METHAVFIPLIPEHKMKQKHRAKSICLFGRGFGASFVVLIAADDLAVSEPRLRFGLTRLTAILAMSA